MHHAFHRDRIRATDSERSSALPDEYAIRLSLLLTSTCSKDAMNVGFRSRDEVFGDELVLAGMLD